MGDIEDFGKLTRIAIINPDKCKPSKCNLECKKKCPPNINGNLVIEVKKDSKTAIINESMCCGISSCAKACPFDAITIINLPTNLTKDTIHRYGPNSFKLHRLPTPRRNQVLGLIGANGTGKSTSLQILSGKIKPNLGKYNESESPSWNEIMKNFSGSELFNYFTKLHNDNLKTVIKPQNVDMIPKIIKGTIRTTLNKYTSDKKNNLIEQLELNHILDRNIEDLSGGELQRFAICVTLLKDVDVYIFDEITSYLDVKQRIKVSKIIRDILLDNSKYVIVVEHDLAILDYMSDYVCVLYGEPGAYGVVTLPYSVREGINAFLDGFIKSENMRIRDYSINFKISDDIERDIERNLDKKSTYKYPDMKKTLGEFKLNIKKGEFNDSEIIVFLGQNGTGKTSMIRLLSGKLCPDKNDNDNENDNIKLDDFKVSYKPQKIVPSFIGTVRELFYNKIQSAYIHPQFISDVIKPMKIDKILDNKVKTLSGGELQKVAIILCLGQPANIYLLDEPSCYLDAEQRLIVSKIIKRFILNSKKTAFVVEHDFIMATYLADKVVVFEGEPGVNCTANSPCSLTNGMNKFLKELDITFRKDPTNFRPRINKPDSQLDQEQKESGKYYFTDN